MQVGKRNVVVGIGQIYLDNEPIGGAKSAITLTMGRTKFFAKPGNATGNVKGVVISETLKLDATIMELDPRYIARVLGLSTTTDTNFRKEEEIHLSGTTHVTFSPAALTLTGTKVKTLDGLTDYTRDADYSATLSTVARISGGAISTGDYINLARDVNNASATYIKFGGSRTAAEMSLKYSLHDSDGYLWQGEIYKALLTNELPIAFNEEENGSYTVSFEGMLDQTRPEGDQLGRFSRTNSVY